MLKRTISVLCAGAVILSIAACKKIDTDPDNGVTQNVTQTVTRIHNNFADVLPDFEFDSEKTENYKESISYSFGAKCSKSKFRKYIDEVKKTGFDKKASEGEGYYAAYSDNGYYTEMTLIDGNITVFIKRK